MNIHDLNIYIYINYHSILFNLQLCTYQHCLEWLQRGLNRLINKLIELPQRLS